MGAQFTVTEQLVSIGRTSVVTVTGTAAKILDGSEPVSVGARFKADIDNTSNIFIGWASDITAGSSAKSGYKLAPGDEIPLPVSDINLLYAIAGTGSQKLYWIAY